MAKKNEPIVNKMYVWELEVEGESHEFKCLVTEESVTTYQDGVDGTAFAEQKNENVAYGTATPAFVGELVQAAVVKRLAEAADPDRPKPVKPEGAAPGGSPLAEMLKASLVKAFQSSANQPGAVDKTVKVDAPPAESEEVVE